MKALLSTLALTLVVTAPTLAYASGREPRGGKPYACNPQVECLAQAAALKGAAADGARRDCRRMPTQGTCFAPDDAQADRATGRTDFDRTDNPARKRR
jgi:hypothetical protein